jgi:CheY-like chemotaxis protein
VIRKDSLIRDVKVIMMSADPSARSSTDNLDSWLIKPIHPSLFFNCLHHLLSNDSESANSDARVTPQVRSEPHKETRVLVVEDNPTNQTLAKAQLTALGYSAEVVGDASQALDTLLGTRYDIVLMDCELPGMDGFAATAELRRREGDARHTAVIALTAHATEADRRRCLEAGMDGYLAKPTKLNSLAEMLDRWHGKAATSPAI